MGSTIQGGISRPYVGQNAQNINDVKQTSDKKTGDVTSPATPQVLRAWAFELAADGTTAAPPPPPPGRPGRDPLVIELGQIEVGTRIELISLSDNPQAEFSDKCKGEIFELPLTGYDVAGRRGTVALNEDQMKEKDIVPGERMLLRQVDKDGNASEAVHVYLDPRGWANQALNEPTADGGSQRVQGRTIDIAVGVHGLQGNPTPGQVEHVLGKAATDATAPKLLEGNVSVVTNKVSGKEHAAMKGVHEALGNLIGGGNYTKAEIEAQVTASGHSWEQNATYKPMVDNLRALIADPKMFDRLAELSGLAVGQPDAARINYKGAAVVGGAATPPSLTTIKLDKALEPGTTVAILNSRTGESVSASQSAAAREVSLNLKDVKDGDPLIMTYQDSAGNPGAPYGFNFSESAKDGKAPKQNPLNFRLSSFAIGNKPAPTQGT